MEAKMIAILEDAASIAILCAIIVLLMIAF